VNRVTADKPLEIPMTVPAIESDQIAVTALKVLPPAVAAVADVSGLPSPQTVLEI
jgi:hypothetical protein